MTPLQISQDYRRASLDCEARGLRAAADHYTALASLYRALAAAHDSAPGSDSSDLDIPIDYEN